VKNHDFTQKEITFFPILGGRAPGAPPPPLNPPLQSKMDNPEKLATRGTQDEDKQNKNTTQYV
jgi:hypothetical protein